jgi:surface antigen
MKLRTTTPASSPRMMKPVLIATALLIAVIGPIQISQSVSADRFDDQINALQQDIDKAQAQASSLAAQAATLQTAVAGLNAQMAVIQGQIDLSQAKYDQLVAQIADTEKKIKADQDALGITIANLYVDSDITPLEMVASSKNISDYLDKQEYRNAVRDQLTSTIAEIKDLKTKLTTQKTDVERVMADQQNSKNALASKRQEQQDLLTQTNGQESAYQQFISQNQAKQSDIRAQQQAYIASQFASTGGATLVKGGAAPDYPWNSSNCGMIGYFSTGGADGNGGDGRGYGCRQCASYAAWRVAKETGYYPINWGNAKDFPSSASGLFPVGYTPKAGSLAVMTGSAAGNFEGHIAWVEAVNGNGTILVSQYNYNYGAGYGMYSEMILSASAFQTYIYIK